MLLAMPQVALMMLGCVTKLFSEIESGRAIPQQYLDLREGLGDNPLVTIVDTAFP